MLGQLPCSTHDNGVLCLQGGRSLIRKGQLVLGACHSPEPQGSASPCCLLPPASGAEVGRLGRHL